MYPCMLVSALQCFLVGGTIVEKKMIVIIPVSYRNNLANDTVAKYNTTQMVVSDTMVR